MTSPWVLSLAAMAAVSGAVLSHVCFRTAHPPEYLGSGSGLHVRHGAALRTCRRFVEAVIFPTQPLPPLLDEPLWLADNGGQPAQRPLDFVWVHFAVWAIIGRSGHPAWIPDFLSVETLSREPKLPNPFGSWLPASPFDLGRYIEISKKILKYGTGHGRQLRCTDLIRTEAGMLDISHALRQHLINRLQSWRSIFFQELTRWFSLRAQALPPAPDSPIPGLDASAPSQGSATTQVLVSAALPAPGSVSPRLAGEPGTAGTGQSEEMRRGSPVPALQLVLADFFRAHASNRQPILPPVVAAVLLSGPKLSSTAGGTPEGGSVLLAHSLVVLTLAELHAGQGGTEVVSGPSFVGHGASDLVSASSQPSMVAGRAYINRVFDGGLEATHPDLFRADFPAAAEFVEAARRCMELARMITCHRKRRKGGPHSVPCSATACAQIILGAVMCVLSADQLDCSRAIRWYQPRVDCQPVPEHIAALLAASRPWLRSLDHLVSVFEDDSRLGSILSNFHARFFESIAAHPDVLQQARDWIRAVTQSRAQNCVPDSGGGGSDFDGDSDGDGGGDSDSNGDGGQDGSHSSPGSPAPTQPSPPPPSASLPSDPSSRPLLAQPGAVEVAQPRNVRSRRGAGYVGDAGPSCLLRAPTAHAASPSSPPAQQCPLSVLPALSSPAHPPVSPPARSLPPSPPSQRADSRTAPAASPSSPPAQQCPLSVLPALSSPAHPPVSPPARSLPSPPSQRAGSLLSPPSQQADSRSRSPSPRTSGDGGHSAGRR